MLGKFKHLSSIICSKMTTDIILIIIKLQSNGTELCKKVNNDAVTLRGVYFEKLVASTAFLEEAFIIIITYETKF